MPEEQPAGVGETDFAGPADPLHETGVHRLLELGELLADRRLRVAEPASGTPDRTLPGHRCEGREVADLDAPEALPFAGGLDPRSQRHFVIPGPERPHQRRSLLGVIAEEDLWGAPRPSGSIARVNADPDRGRADEGQYPCPLAWY